MAQDLFLTIDVGTGSVRAALVGISGKVLAIAAREHEQIVPQFGWSEQRPADWWAGVAASIREVLDKQPDARSRISAVAACGQMHGTVLMFTRYGRLVKAIGSNVEAVRLSGIPVAWYTMSVYVISGVLAAAAGIVSASRTGVGSANIGVGAELDAIAAVVIGGASLMGGRGGAFNTFIGVIVLGIIANMMNLARVPGYHQQVFMGCIIIGAMLLQYASNWLRR